MPLTGAGKKTLTAMEGQYGPEKGKSVFYAKMNKDPKFGGKMHKGGGSAKKYAARKSSRGGRATAGRR